MKQTSEQTAIVESESSTIVIDALAGCTKSTTLKFYAEARPKKRFVYVAFNSSTKEEAKKNFPRNVRCSTWHGLAYNPYGLLYKDKLGNCKESAVSAALKCDYMEAKSALETATAFLCSADDKISDKHVPGHGLIDEDKAVWLAGQLWERMQDTANSAIQMPHDGYLKLYQLSRPLLDTNIIMVDEFQDSNALALDILTRQTTGKVCVGDSNQSIYAFRKAFNALDRVQAEERFALTKSFRFGPGIAAIATLLLRDWKDEKKTLIGAGRHPSVFSVDENQPHAIIGRTNSGLFEAAVGLVKDNKPFGYAGGIGGYRMDMIMSAYQLKVGQRPYDAFIGSFPSFMEMEAYAEAIDDKELKMLIKIVEKFGKEIPHYISEIKARASGVLTGREVALGTGHKMKGAQFDAVIILDDFTDLKIKRSQGSPDEGPSDEEINLLYVAMTRAERALRPNQATRDWVNDIRARNMLMAGDVSSFVGVKHKPWRNFIKSSAAAASGLKNEKTKEVTASTQKPPRKCEPVRRQRSEAPTAVSASLFQ